MRPSVASEIGSHSMAKARRERGGRVLRLESSCGICVPWGARGLENLRRPPRERFLPYTNLVKELSYVPTSMSRHSLN